MDTCRAEKTTKEFYFDPIIATLVPRRYFCGVVLSFYVLVFNIFVLLAPHVCFHIFS